MAITKKLAWKERLDVGINYVLNGDKTEDHTLTATLNCDPGREYRQMMETKQAAEKTDGAQYYHIIQSFQPGEVIAEQVLKIAQEFAAEHLSGYSEITELDAPLLNTLIEKIVIHEGIKDPGGMREQEAEIYYCFIGKINLRESVTTYIFNFDSRN